MIQPVDTSVRRAEPAAKIHTHSKTGYKSTGGLGQVITLHFSLGAIREFGLKHGERVDILWDRHNEVWEKSVMIVRRNGSQRSLTGNFGHSKPPSSMKLAIGTAVLQYHIPIELLTHRLPILDYVDNEIWVDFSAKDLTHPRTAELKTEQFSALVLGSKGEMKVDVRWGVEYKRVLKEIAKLEDITLSGMILREMDRFIQDRYPEVWGHLEPYRHNKTTEESDLYDRQ